MRVDRVMAVLKNGDEIKGHVIVSRISGEIRLKVDIINRDDVVLVVRINGNKCHFVQLNNILTEYMLDEEDREIEHLEAIAIRNGDIFAFASNSNVLGVETLYNFYVENKSNTINSDTYRDVMVSANYDESNEISNEIGDEVVNFASTIIEKEEENVGDAVENTMSNGKDEKKSNDFFKSDDKKLDKKVENSESILLNDDKIYGKHAPFYNAIGNQLDDLFSRYDREEILEKNIANSRFSKIYYDENNYYVVGEIKNDDNIPELVCYGYPGEGGKNPPEEVKNNYEWLPIDKNDVTGFGYYMMYQNALTGDIIQD